MAYIAIVPPIRFINIGSAIGPTDQNHPDDVLIIRAFMIYLSNHRKDLRFTNSYLSTLAGQADSMLFQMIIDYKEFKKRTFSALMVPEEQQNSRVTPQDERFALGPIQTTIMALNHDVKVLPGYGDTIIDVMCNLFPIREILLGLPVRADAYWRDLARNRVPWKQWLLKHQEDAANERQGAIQRMSSRGVTSAEDNELFTLLNPYRNDMKDFYERHTRIVLTASPNPSIQGQVVTLTATVKTLGGNIPVGTVTFNVMPQGRGLQQIQRQPLVNGSATITINVLPKGRNIVKADYPNTGDIIGSSAEIPHQVN